MTAPEAAPSLLIARSAAAGLLIAMPAALANVLLADQDPKPRGALNATFLGLLVGFVLAGFMAGREVDSQVAKSGATAAFAVFVPIEIVGILGRLDRGDPINLITIVLVGFIAAGAGTVGSQLGARRRARKEAT